MVPSISHPVGLSWRVRVVHAGYLFPSGAETIKIGRDMSQSVVSGVWRVIVGVGTHSTVQVRTLLALFLNQFLLSFPLPIWILNRVSFLVNTSNE